MGTQRRRGRRDPQPVRPDQSRSSTETTGLPLIQLPDGFRYMTYSWTGDPLQDGNAVPETCTSAWRW
jgi:hypothetical protein